MNTLNELRKSLQQTIELADIVNRDTKLPHTKDIVYSIWHECSLLLKELESRADRNTQNPQEK